MKHLFLLECARFCYISNWFLEAFTRFQTLVNDMKENIEKLPLRVVIITLMQACKIYIKMGLFDEATMYIQTYQETHTINFVNL